MINEDFEKLAILFGISEKHFNNMRDLEKSLKEAKAIYLNKKNEDAAKQTWIFENVFSAQYQYLKSFRLMKSGKYSEAWNMLIGAEDAIHFVGSHINEEDMKRYSLDFIECQGKRFQYLFPNKMFASAEIIKDEIRCSICNKIITPRDFCEHKTGEIYNGEMCCYIVTKWTPISVSVVSNPRNKRCLIFPQSTSGSDGYNYNVLKHLFSLLISPYDEWDFKETKILSSHKHFNNYPKTYLCPCESGKTYSECCLKNPDGVFHSHIDFILPYLLKPEQEKVYYNI